MFKLPSSLRDNVSYDRGSMPLYIEPLTRKIDEDFVPESGSEFIHLRIHKEKQLELFHDPDSDEEEVFEDWLKTEQEKFTSLAKALKDNRSNFQKKFPQVHNTRDFSEKEWCRFCLGSKASFAIYKNPVDKKVSHGHAPLLSIVIHLSQDEVITLLKYLGYWVDKRGFSNEIGRWLFALMASLEMPLQDREKESLNYCYESIIGMKYGAFHKPIMFFLSLLKSFQL